MAFYERFLVSLCILKDLCILVGPSQAACGRAAKTKILFMYALKDDFGKNIDIRSEKNQKQENKQLTNH